MAFRLSTGLRTKLLQGGTSGTNGFAALLKGGKMYIYSGSQPTTVEAVETGSLLAVISCSSGTGGLEFGTAASGILPKNADQWSGTCGTAGVAGWFRFYDSLLCTGADTAGTAVRFDGAIGSVSGELILNPTTLVLTAPVIVDSFPVSIAMTQS